MGPETDEMSVEFTRLTETTTASSGDNATARISYSTRSKRLTGSDMSLLQEIATKQNLS